MNTRNRNPLAAAVFSAVLLAAGQADGAESFDPVKQPFALLPSISITGFDVSSGNVVAFAPWFDPITWRGDVSALPVTTSGETDLANKLWSAEARVAAQHWDSGRRIVTRNASGTAVPFRWAQLSAEQRTAIGSETVLNFLRGDRSNEIEIISVDGDGVATVLSGSPTGTLRGRYGVLGDFLHGESIYIGPPLGGFTFEGYFSFRSAQANRPGRVYAGGNDGMVHAFDAATGDEVFAYIPSMLIPKLAQLSAVNYAHQYYVDGNVTAADVNFGADGLAGRAPPDWRTVLIGGLGAGGKGLWALDVTSAQAADETEAAAKVLWEITPDSPGFSGLGYTYGDQSIVRVPCTSAATNNRCWAAIVPNGYLGAGGRALLYVIDVKTGTLLRTFDTGAGSAGSPNGLSTPATLDSDRDDVIDAAYAGDLDGNVWKFGFAGTNPAAWTIERIYNPVAEGHPPLPITTKPDIAGHPDRGFLVYFASGRLLSSDDVADSSIVNYATALWDWNWDWDGAGPNPPAPSSAWLEQTMSEGTYGGQVRVRLATGKTPNWNQNPRCDDDPPPVAPAPCANEVPPHKGWRTALAPGEHVVTNGFVRDARYHVMTVNPSIVKTPKPDGENWLVEFNYLTGGAPEKLVFDLSQDSLLNDLDRATDAGGAPIPGPTGIPMGIYQGPGMFSAPTLVSISSTLATTIFNNNPYVSPGSKPDDPVEEEEGGRGVAGGHFDVDIYYPTICTTTTTGGTTGTKASTTIQVSATPLAWPANFGGIQIGGSPFAAGLSNAEVPDGTATTTIAAKIRDKINAGSSGYTATVSGSIVTVSAPVVGTAHNGLVLDFVAGSSTAPVLGPNPVGSFNITDATQDNKLITSIKCGATDVITPNTVSTGTTGGGAAARRSARIANLANGLAANDINGYTVSCTSAGACTVTGPAGAAACSTLSISKDNSITLSTTTPAFAQPVITPGTYNLAQYLSAQPFSGGSDPGPGTTTVGTCNSKKHTHEYDDIYDVTGVNMLNASDPAFNLVNAISSTSTQFKVVAQNQYLNPAVTLDIGGQGHQPVKQFVTGATLDLATLPTYTRANIGTFEFNMPRDAFKAKDWWGNGDLRAGLHPTQTGCVKSGSGSNGGTLFQPVVPPANGVDGPGTHASPRDQGVRHNGAITFQLIRADTPNSAMEQNVSGRPEYGWRVKAANFFDYVLAEYTVFWHHPNGACYGQAGWTKTPPEDPTSCFTDKLIAGQTVAAAQTACYKSPAPGSADPGLGTARASVVDASTVVTITGSGLDSVRTTVITITYDDGSKLIITMVELAAKLKADGSVDKWKPPTVTTEYVPGSTPPGGGGGGAAGNALQGSTVANTVTGYQQSRNFGRLGRVSWRELIRD